MRTTTFEASGVGTGVIERKTECSVSLGVGVMPPKTQL